jgi:hypothetical protein
VAAGSFVAAGSWVGAGSLVAAASPVGSGVGVSVAVWVSVPWASTPAADESKLLKASNIPRIMNQAGRFFSVNFIFPSQAKIIFNYK